MTGFYSTSEQGWQNKGKPRKKQSDGSSREFYIVLAIALWFVCGVFWTINRKANEAGIESSTGVIERSFVHATDINGAIQEHKK